jgi:hypothetical protein
MGEPVILDGGDRTITIMLPPSFQNGTPDATVTAKENFSVFSVTQDTEPFQTIVITDTATHIEVLIPIKARRWRIEVK